MRLQDKVAIVTGAASGIGKATATVLAREGAKVVAADIDTAGAEKTVAEIEGGGGSAVPAPVDIADEATIEAMYTTAVDAFGRVDVVANVAAAINLMNSDHNVHDADEEVWRKTFDANARGTALSCKYALRHMLPRGSGAIVNMASTAGIAADITYPAYASSKAAIMATTRWVATNYGRKGIRCNAIAPGLIVTPGARAVMPQEQLDMYLTHTPAVRLGIPDDIANATLFLSTEEAAFVNGTTLVVDGGMTVHMPSWADTFQG